MCLPLKADIPDGQGRPSQVEDVMQLAPSTDTQEREAGAGAVGACARGRLRIPAAVRASTPRKDAGGRAQQILGRQPPLPHVLPQHKHNQEYFRTVSAGKTNPGNPDKECKC